MRHFIYIIVLFAVTYTTLSASCGSTSCPLHNINYLGKGKFNLGISYEYIHQNQIYVGSSKSFVGAIREHHDEVSTLNTIMNFSAGYGVTDNLSLNIVIPFVHREHSHIHHHHGEDLWESWNITGLGDAKLIANYNLLRTDNETTLNVLGGVKFATGETDLINSEGEKAEITIQPGSGSVDYVIGADFSTSLATVAAFEEKVYSTLPLSIGVTYQINQEGKDDYQFGNVLLAHIGSSFIMTKKSDSAFTNQQPFSITRRSRHHGRA